MKRFTFAIMVSALLCGTAAADPVLKADVVITGPIVTVGDMFGNADLLAEQPMFRAPRPGTTGKVPLADIQAAANRLGISSFDSDGLVAVNVSRAASVVDETVLAEVIAADLRARGILADGMSADTRFDRTIAPINADAVEHPATVTSMRYMPGSGIFTARVTVAGVEQPLDLSGTIELMVEVPHLKSTLPAGAVLGPADVEMRRVPLRYAESVGVAAVEDLIGKALTRQSREGMLLKASDVTVPQLIGKNDLVTIYFRKGPMTLSVKGQAVTGATEGGALQVLNLMSKRVITATAIAAGAVEVSAEPLTLAGL